MRVTLWLCGGSSVSEHNHGPVTQCDRLDGTATNQKTSKASSPPSLPISTYSLAAHLLPSSDDNGSGWLHPSFFQAWDILHRISSPFPSRDSTRTHLGLTLRTHPWHRQTRHSRKPGQAITQRRGNLEAVHVRCDDTTPSSWAPRYTVRKAVAPTLMVRAGSSSGTLRPSDLIIWLLKAD